MILLTIDSSTSEIPKKNFTTFKDFFDTLSDGIKNEKRVISTISINNELMKDGKHLELLENSISTIDSINIVTVERLKLIEDNIEGVDDHINKLSENIDICAERFRQGNEIEANNYFAAVVEGIRWFNYSIDLMISFLQIDSEKIMFEGKKLKSYIDGITPVVDSIADSQEKQDWIMLADQLEYELLPQIKNWKKIVASFIDYV